MTKFRTLRILLAALFCVALIGCDGPKEREAAYLERGKTLFKSGNYVKARLEFRNALQINPKGVETRFYLATIEQKVGNFRAAYAGFEKLITEKPDYLPAQLELARLLFMAGQSGRALPKVKMVLAAQPENTAARALNAAIAMKAGKLDEAMTEARAVLKLDPGNADAGSVVAAILSRQQRFDEAIKSIDEVIAHDRTQIALRLVKISLLIKQKQFPEAEAVYRELIELQPKQLPHRARLARLMAESKRLDDAETVLHDAIKSMPTEAKAKLLLVDFLSAHRSSERAMRELLNFVKKEPKNDVLLMGLAALHQKQKDLKQAEAVYRRIIGLDEEGRAAVTARTALIRLKLRQGDKKIADAELEKLLKRDPTNAAGLLLRAGRSLEEKDFLQATTDLRLVLRDDPNSKRAMKLLSVAHIRAGNLQLAKETLQKLIRVDRKDTDAQLQLAQLMARNRDYEEAKSLLSEILVRKPNNVQALQTKAEIALVEQDFDEAEQVSKQLLTGGAPAAVSRRLTGLVHFAKRRYPEAIRDLSAALEDDPKSSQAMATLARSFVAAKQAKEGVAYFKGFVAKHGDNAGAHLVLGEIAAVAAELKVADEHFTKAAALTSKPSVTYRQYGRAMVRTGHYKAAVAAYQSALKSDPDSEILLFELALAHQSSGDPSSAISLYRKILTRNADVDAAANNFAALIADFRYQDKAALTEALRFTTRFQTSQSPFFLDTLGWVHYRLGNSKDAVEILERAVRSGPSIPAVHYHLGMAYLATKQTDLAREQLKKATTGDPKYTGVEDARAALAKL